MTETVPAEVTPGRWATVLPVWVVAIIGAVLVGMFAARGEYLTWLPIVLATATILTFCLQIGRGTKDGLTERMTASVGGSVVILGIATGVLALMGG